mmetsp:Transcript_47684/g.154100  ORF Transcript_47684/g.154100 Transcript_47684/m.154100 type:complete len:231 (-) Transcript_47684:810-1502(-)
MDTQAVERASGIAPACARGKRRGRRVGGKRRRETERYTWAAARVGQSAERGARRQRGGRVRRSRFGDRTPLARRERPSRRAGRLAARGRRPSGRGRAALPSSGRPSARGRSTWQGPPWTCLPSCPAALTPVRHPCPSSWPCLRGPPGPCSRPCPSPPASSPGSCSPSCRLRRRAPAPAHPPSRPSRAAPGQQTGPRRQPRRRWPRRRRLARPVRQACPACLRSPPSATPS